MLLADQLNAPSGLKKSLRLISNWYLKVCSMWALAFLPLLSWFSSARLRPLKSLLLLVFCLWAAYKGRFWTFHVFLNMIYCYYLFKSNKNRCSSAVPQTPGPSLLCLGSFGFPRMILSPDLWLLSLLFSSGLASCLLAVDPKFFHMCAAAHLRFTAENHLLFSQSDLCWVPSGAGWRGT